MTEALSAGLSWADLLASVTLAGGFVAGALVTPPSPLGRRILHLCTLAIALVLAAEVAFNAYRMWRISGIGGFTLFRDVAEMHWTRLWGMRCLGALVLGAALAFDRGTDVPTAALAVGWLGLRSLQGHAGAHGTAAAAADWVHLTAVSAWLGALVQFSVMDPPGVAALRRLRLLALFAVAVLIPSGAYGALLHVRSAGALFGTGYGRTLLVKLSLVLPLVGLGAWNHFRLSPRALSGDGAALRRLRGSVRTELVLGALVLLASAILVSLPMPHR